MTHGTLYALGVGPGDPELLTLKAARLLGQVDMILAAASPKNDDSHALKIAAPHLRPGVPVTRLDFPMTRDPEVLEASWQANARTVLRLLAPDSSVRSAAFLTLGDPLTYSTFGYLLRTLRLLAPDLPVEVVPGITSYHAAAARAGRVLVEGEETLTVIPGLRPETLASRLATTDNAVILKAYRSFPAIRQALEAMNGRFEQPLLVSELHRPGERLTSDLQAAEATPPYLSLILATKNRGRS